MSHLPRGTGRTAILVVALSTLLALLLGDLGLRALSKWKQWKWNSFSLIIYESWLAHYNSRETLAHPAKFDPMLGWRYVDPPTPPPPGKRCTFNHQGWRAAYDYETAKKRPRVAVFGDSYVNYCHHDDEELVTHFLQERAGRGVEVMNFGVPGFGLDQISLTATDVAIDYAPDVYVLAFITADLERSCGALIPKAMKPRFELEGDSLRVSGVPVRTAEEVFAAHQGWATKVWDALQVWTFKSYVARLAAEAVMANRIRRCFGPLNVAILKRARDRLPPPAKLVFAFLDGKPLPEDFVREAKAIPDAYIDLPSQAVDIAAKLGVTPGHIPDGHADAALNRVFAEAIWRAVEPWIRSGRSAR